MNVDVCESQVSEAEAEAVFAVEGVEEPFG